MSVRVRRGEVRLLDAWEDGRWLWRERADAGPTVELAVAVLRRATGGLVLLMALCSVVAAQSGGSYYWLWNGAMLAFLFLAVPTGTAWGATEWLLRAQAGAEQQYRNRRRSNAQG